MLALRLLRYPELAIPLYTNLLYWRQRNRSPFADHLTNRRPRLFQRPFDDHKIHHHVTPSTD